MLGLEDCVSRFMGKRTICKFLYVGDPRTGVVRILCSISGMFVDDWQAARCLPPPPELESLRNWGHLLGRKTTLGNGHSVVGPGSNLMAVSFLLLIRPERPICVLE